MNSDGNKFNFSIFMPRSNGGKILAALINRLIINSCVKCSFTLRIS